MAQGTDTKIPVADIFITSGCRAMRNLRGPRYSLRLLVLGPTLLLLAVASGSPAMAGSARSLRPPGLSISNPTVAEEAGTAVFVVRLSRRSPKPVTVRYATADISATAGSDYQRSAGSLTFKRGERTKSISVRVLDDGIAEDDGAPASLVVSYAYSANPARVQEGRDIENDGFV